MTRILAPAAYAVVTVALGISTFLSPVVYGSVWFTGMWVLFAIILAASLAACRMWRKGGAFLLHLSFLAILAGGALTWLTQEKGNMRIEPGEEVKEFFTPGGLRPLPCGITLSRFEVVYYPGGEVPRDYVSHLEIDGRPETVSMNKILDLGGYRLCQASYDETGATILSVNHDPYGIPLSYAGYVMFGIGGLWVMMARKGRFRTLLRGLGIALILLMPGRTFASSPDETVAGVPRHMADSMKVRQVIYGGRLVTFNTFARDVVTKLHGKPCFRGLTPEQTLLSFRMFPKQWKGQPLIKVKDKEVARALGIGGGYASLENLFDSAGNYRVAALYHLLPGERRRAVEELDEKAGILLMHLQDELIVTPPADVTLMGDSRVKLELLYNSVSLGKLIFIALFCSFFCRAIWITTGNRFRFMILSAEVLLWTGILMSVINFALQWILSERIPLSNTYETLEFIALVMGIILIALSLRRGMREGDALMLTLGTLFAGVVALVAYLVEINPVVTPLVPVLHSPWLSLHVSLVMTSYSILGLTFVAAIAALMVPSMAERLRSLSTCLLYPGVWLLGLGIFTGAVWANVSWGQYWSWDPKETWALVTLLVYAFPLHGSFAFAPRSAKAFHIYMIFAISVMAMTYFGVNYLNSLHAYGA